MRRGLLSRGFAGIRALVYHDITSTYAKDLPAGMWRRDDDRDAGVAHLRFPLGHHRAIRITVFSSGCSEGIDEAPK